ncbi:hypothetical protein C1878_00320 [Gordonibacter sp. 28C]|uniref:TorD/DmsD family molecular chaperone n=1 Tax=Gordonibacter sp. 28C TaxID=2078569 RepID=UPI000DF84305|nr:molecular chaperone TorD family protein [Gordonibacter sp. 28C]RDB64346.1 hypothetical protein C1878_00320 [Gordonibacter sp. 28C]
MNEDVLLHAIGMADSCELMSAAFAFPDEDLANALSSGLFMDDALACLLDADAGETALGQASAALTDFARTDAAELIEVLRKGNTIMFLTPGNDVPVWPYEAAFRYTAENHQGAPSLFRSARTIDVERHMREAGVLPKNARREPSDSVWNEFSFLSFLYGSLAAALQEGRDGDAEVWRDRIARFWDEHASCWLSAFMEKTREESSAQTYGKEYAALASLGKIVLYMVEADVSQWKNRG